MPRADRRAGVAALASAPSPSERDGAVVGGVAEKFSKAGNTIQRSSFPETRKGGIATQRLDWRFN
jgi:hypothetical protein